jgi:predicted dehydrogenase
VAWVDANPASLKLAQATLDIPPGRCFTSLEDAFAAGPADAVLATVAVPAHVPVALAALDAGKHVLIEKPFAMSLAEAQQVVDAAAAHDRIVMISQNYRFFPAVQAVIELVGSGELGTIGMVRVDFRKNIQPGLRADHPYHLLDQPLLMDMAIHHFDLMRAVLGQEPTGIACHAWNPPWSPLPGLTAGTATVTFDGGAVASYRGNWLSTGSPTAWAGEWHIEGDRGEVVWTSRGDIGNRLGVERVLVRPLAGPAQEREVPTMQHAGREGVLAAFAEAIGTGAEPVCSGRDNLGSVALMTAAIDAVVAERTMPVSAVPAPEVVS